MKSRLARAVVAALSTVLLLSTAANAPAAPQAPQFKVIAFYSGTYDDAHIAFEKEAAVWFPQVAAQYNFSYQQTNNWSMLTSLTTAQANVVMFLDDVPTDSGQRAGFQHYMQNGGAYFGWHVSAYNDSGTGWPWFNNTLMGTGTFNNNTWFPTTAILHTDSSHAATRRLPTTWMAGVSEWYSWQNDLRQNPNIQVLASVDASSFPVGTDPAQSWYSGYYPILWTNKQYKMLYANFGHDAMNYTTKTPLSSTFADPVQDKFIIDGLLWLGGGTPTDAPTDQINPGGFFTVINKGNNKCVDARSAGTTNGTVIQQYACNNSTAQQFQFQGTNGPWLRVNNRANTAESLDVSGRSTSDGAGIQLWAFGGGTNQQWQAVQEPGGYWHFTSMATQKCLTASGSGDGTQLTQATCTGIASQSFKLQQQP
ncbi:ThuA domain-containing protein [Kutzneria sp. 744]|uniref:ThuA domain-containing protein n=1 Tax=Kutzneria sp. (strain 744) TaxID=345341 RepID=UPI0009FFB33D|nr:ThuA domain-containing protein [Kutzneria sp. 744]